MGLFTASAAKSSCPNACKPIFLSFFCLPLWSENVTSPPNVQSAQSGLCLCDLLGGSTPVAWQAKQVDSRLNKHKTSDSLFSCLDTGALQDRKTLNNHLLDAERFCCFVCFFFYLLLISCCADLCSGSPTAAVSTLNCLLMRVVILPTASFSHKPDGF